METPKNEKKKNPTAEDIREISEKHLKDVPNADAVPDMPASGGKQFIKDDDLEKHEAEPEMKRSDLKP